MEKMKHFYVFLLALALLAPACLRDMTSPQNDPEVPSVSVDAESLTRISATLEGTLPDAKDIVSYGFEMTGTNFDDAPEVVIEGTGVDEDGHFTHTVTVKPGAFYAVRTFISNGHYKKYSQDVTLKVPLTSVATPSEVSIVNNKLIASIVDDGGRDIREVGFCWSESPDKKIIRRNRLKGQLTENGTITAELPEMEAGFTYYFLAYAENATGGQEEFGYSTDPYPYLMKDENIVDIQDPAFFSYLVNRFDGNRDGRLSDQELQAVTAISVSTDQIDHNIFQNLMTSALEQAAEDLYDVCKPGRNNRVTVTPLPFTVTLNIAGGAFFKPAEAEIHVDGVLVGNGGAPILLPEGRHTIEVKAQGYKPAAVTVNVNSDQNININLEK